MANENTTVENYYDYEESGESGWYQDTFDDNGDLVSSEQISSDDDNDDEY